jgi:hypothetical protein
MAYPSKDKKPKTKATARPSKILPRPDVGMLGLPLKPKTPDVMGGKKGC